MELDRNGLEIVPRTECLDLLRRGIVGRVIVTDKALPAAFPVNYALLDDDVVFLTRPGSKLEAAEAELVVAFEVDEIDPVSQSGWSVLVQGWASVISAPEDLARAYALPLEPWAPGERFSYVRIRAEVVSGRPLVTTLASTPALGPPVETRFAACPSCGSQELLPVAIGRFTNFVCTWCAACWRGRGRDPAAGAAGSVRRLFLPADVHRRLRPRRAGCPSPHRGGRDCSAVRVRSGGPRVARAARARSRRRAVVPAASTGGAHRRT